MPPEKDKIEHFLSSCSFLHLALSKVSKACCVVYVSESAQQILRIITHRSTHNHRRLCILSKCIQLPFNWKNSCTQVFLIYKSRCVIQTLNCKIRAKNLLKHSVLIDTYVFYICYIHLPPNRKKVHIKFYWHL